MAAVGDSPQRQGWAIAAVAAALRCSQGDPHPAVAAEPTDALSAHRAEYARARQEAKLAAALAATDSAARSAAEDDRALDEAVLESKVGGLATFACNSEAEAPQLSRARSSVRGENPSIRAHARNASTTLVTSSTQAVADDTNYDDARAAAGRISQTLTPSNADLKARATQGGARSGPARF